ncbi:MAG TPA: ABC transporter permease, partial [Candidatus Caccomonas pullistercoris]|nr:ABC transporter permease [Candidatus Caccomonas pullistercoris]
RSAIYVKYKPGMRAEAEQAVAGVLKKFEVPEDRVEVTSFDEYIRTYYEKELRYFRLFSMLMVGSVLITLFGVVSMSMYTMRMHRRSIAIRRIYGADFWLLARHYLGGYVGVSLLAAVVAYPVGLYAMTEWLKAYTERVEVGWLQGVAVLAMVLALVVAVVLWQVRRVMNDDPADVVRNE